MLRRSRKGAGYRLLPGPVHVVQGDEVPQGPVPLQDAAGEAKSGASPTWRFGCREEIGHCRKLWCGSCSSCPVRGSQKRRRWRSSRDEGREGPRSGGPRPGGLPHIRSRYWNAHTRCQQRPETQQLRGLGRSACRSRASAHILRRRGGPLLLLLPTSSSCCSPASGCGGGSTKTENFVGVRGFEWALEALRQRLPELPGAKVPRLPEQGRA
mmetsp:Transcript_56769/g.120781  ORF Transcript_56769/g.120781 Transcript_56769/m.120781 type:complete len:211 (-) Transcript_56769:116-748(-)